MYYFVTINIHTERRDVVVKCGTSERDVGGSILIGDTRLSHRVSRDNKRD